MRAGSRRAAGLVGRVLAVVAVGALGSALGAVVLGLPREPGGLTLEVRARLEASGVAQPVTAVLLNFRGYDTWLELVVLVLAMLGVLCARRRNDLGDVPPAPAPDLVLVWLLPWLAPLMVLAAGYLLWLGTFASGGAFQSGVVLGATGVLARLAGHRSAAAIPPACWRAALVLGLAAFFVVGAGAWLAGRALLEYPPAWAGLLIVGVETAAALAIGLVLASLYVGLAAPPEGRRAGAG